MKRDELTPRLVRRRAARQDHRRDEGQQRRRQDQRGDPTGTSGRGQHQHRRDGGGAAGGQEAGDIAVQRLDRIHGLRRQQPAIDRGTGRTMERGADDLPSLRPLDLARPRRAPPQRQRREQRAQAPIARASIAQGHTAPCPATAVTPPANPAAKPVAASVSSSNRPDAPSRRPAASFNQRLRDLAAGGAWAIVVMARPSPRSATPSLTMVNVDGDLRA